MSWWFVLLILPDICLMVALVPWMLLQVLEWVLCKDAKALPEQEQRLQQLDEAGIESSLAWPALPRSGRYQDLDRQAQENLAAPRASLS